MIPLPQRCKADPLLSGHKTDGHSVQKDASFLPSQEMAERLWEVAKRRTPRVLCASWHEMPLRSQWPCTVLLRAWHLAHFGCRALRSKASVKRAGRRHEKIFSCGQIPFSTRESVRLIRYSWGGR